ncbi:MAG: hypothetical protein HC825_00595 [Oscillatoriales cyanobacterium RM1_1_9]|nr:hypothetical protein [Oscillatoriales cyanobacterium RM1_1_9]
MSESKSEKQVQNSVNQPESIKPVAPVEQPVITQQTPVSSPVANAQSGIGAFFRSWKLKLGVVLVAIAGVALLSYLWPHIVATQGLKSWSRQSSASPISCMMLDTNDDGYVSCSATMPDEQIVSLQCSSNLLNLGCRVNYGSAAPPSIKVKRKAVEG